MTLPEFSDIIECPNPPITGNIAKFTGVVSEIRVVGNTMFFKVGAIPVSIRKLNDRPDWFQEGITVEIDTEHNIYKGYTAFLASRLPAESQVASTKPMLDHPHINGGKP